MGEFFNDNLLAAFYAGLVLVYVIGVVTGATAFYLCHCLRAWKAARHAV